MPRPYRKQNMDINPEPSAPPAPVRPALGLAIASLVLGILAVVLSWLLVGGLLGIVGLVLGLVHLKRKCGQNGMAGCGVGLSVLGIICTIGFAGFYYYGFQQFKKAMEHTDSGTPVTEWQGVPAPDFSVTTLDGQKLTLSDLKGKRVVLDFWATWCPPCRKEIPHFIQLAKDIPKDQLVIVGLSSEDESKLKEFAQKQGINYPIATEKNLPAPYSDIHSIPTTFFLDRHGIIQTVVVGYHDLDTLKRHATEPDYAGPPKSPPAKSKPDESK
jgi:cytochrome c biogenesis protein CcmG/thiol:disulfide interchange protein DsbE